MNKRVVIICAILGVFLLVGCFFYFNINNKSLKSIDVDLSNLTYRDSSSYTDLKVYSKDEFEVFFNDYNSGNLPNIYVTEFVFDGVGMYKTYDLDDFIDSGNYFDIDTFKTTAVNINSSGNYILSGDMEGIILVNTNDLDGDVKISLNGVNIDSGSKKVPAIYVYNKDISYDKYKVTISTLEGTSNYITGGKFKKVSLVGKDELANYSNKYSGETSTWYSTYTNYYGVYTSDDINNILFAKVTASDEDLRDGDPYYFYKGAGAISSDIDLYFEGAGYLEVSSKGKEGIETKGNLVFSGGIGDYDIIAYDDCLNTTTKNGDGVHNDMIIDVISLTAIVDLDSDEGDALDSNGSLTINGGTIIALSHPGSDAGLDSENGTYINGGTILATGDMYNQILGDSKQNFMALSFSDRVVKDDIITLTDSNNNVIFSYKTDRDYSNLVYSSSKLVVGDYSLYKDGIIDGESFNGFYTSINSFTEGGLLGYTGTGMMGGMPGQAPGNRPEDGKDMTPPDGKTSPEMSECDNTTNMVPCSIGSSINKVFSISDVSNLFSGIMAYGVD